MTPPLIAFFVPGIPFGQPRARSRAFKKRDGVWTASVYDGGGDKIEEWKHAIIRASRPHIPREPLTGALCVDLTFFFPRPKYLQTKKFPACAFPHNVKPDRDNADKAVLDSLTKLRIWEDDNQACQGSIEKWWCAIGGQSGMNVLIRPAREWMGMAIIQPRMNSPIPIAKSPCTFTLFDSRPFK